MKSPLCKPASNGDTLCKPTAASVAQLANGNILYWQAIEGTENMDYTLAPEAGVWSRDSQARLLILRSDPKWKSPFPVRGVSGSEAQNYDELPPDQALLGRLGVPGRPGDGWVGSVFGQFYEAPPVAPPDDPASNDGDMFCADLIQLADGRILIAGGTDYYNDPNVPYDAPVIGGWGVPELEGLRNTRIYDPKTNRFTRAGAMKYARWYPTMVTLPKGDVLVASGVTKLVKSTQASQVRRTETFSLKTKKWTENYAGMASENSLPLYPRMHLMPNGKIFYSGNGAMNGFGPTGWAIDEALYAMQQFYNPAKKEWEMVGPAPLGVRNGAFSVLMPLKPPYDVGQILVGGGTLLFPTPSTYLATPFTELVTVNKSGDVSSELTGMLNNPRWFSTAVVLPDGKVAAFSGANTDEVLFPGPNIPIREAELYDPKTGEWSSLGSGSRDRTYHSSAILLPDARVLVGGHSPIPAFNHRHTDMPAPFANNHKDPSFEIFSPPYLFRGARPTISHSPAGVGYGKSFKVTMGNSAAVDSVVLSRLPAQTHTMAADARTVVLKFKQSGRNLTVQAPPTGVTAPPGPYYLFVNRKTSKGPVPSVAAITTVGRANATKALQPVKADTLLPLLGDTTETTGGTAGTARSSTTEVADTARTVAAEPASRVEGHLASARTSSRSSSPLPVVLVATLLSLGAIAFAGRRLASRRAPP